jgi:hypothetical protein
MKSTNEKKITRYVCSDSPPTLSLFFTQLSAADTSKTKQKVNHYLFAGKSAGFARGKLLK